MPVESCAAGRARGREGASSRAHGPPRRARRTGLAQPRAAGGQPAGGHRGHGLPALRPALKQTLSASPPLSMTSIGAEAVPINWKHWDRETPRRMKSNAIRPHRGRRGAGLAAASANMAERIEVASSRSRATRLCGVACHHSDSSAQRTQRLRQLRPAPARRGRATEQPPRPRSRDRTAELSHVALKQGEAAAGSAAGPPCYGAITTARGGGCATPATCGGRGSWSDKQTVHTVLC
jgi:hypothetical protein